MNIWGNKLVQWFVFGVVVIFIIYQWNATDAAFTELKTSTNALAAEVNTLIANYEQLKTSYATLKANNEEWKTAYNTLKAQNDWYRKILIEPYGWKP